MAQPAADRALEGAPGAEAPERHRQRETSASPSRSHPPLEQGEIEEDAAPDPPPASSSSFQPADDRALKQYRWCRCPCDPAHFHGHDHYYLQMDTQQSQWEQPSEPFWLWDAHKQALDPVGLQQPDPIADKQQQPSDHPAPGPSTSDDHADPDYYGYNPKIHGSYDPNAAYAQYHRRKREQEAGFDPGTSGTAAPVAPGPAVVTAYGAEGAFNRFTGAFQGPDQSADRHSDHSKSGRQMNAYFDVDAAANSHDGKSLKEERRNEKLSKRQIKELAEKRRAKKEKKRLDFYKT